MGIDGWGLPLFFFLFFSLEAAVLSSICRRHRSVITVSISYIISQRDHGDDGGPWDDRDLSQASIGVFLGAQVDSFICSFWEALVSIQMGVGKQTNDSLSLFSLLSLLLALLSPNVTVGTRHGHNIWFR